MGPYYYAKPCDLLATFYNGTDALMAKFPACAPPDAWVAVKADATGSDKAMRSASVNMSFGMALWLALTLHAIGIEVYVSCQRSGMIPAISFLADSRARHSYSSHPPSRSDFVMCHTSGSSRLDMQTLDVLG